MAALLMAKAAFPFNYGSVTAVYFLGQRNNTTCNCSPEHMLSKILPSALNQFLSMSAVLLCAVYRIYTVCSWLLHFSFFLPFLFFFWLRLCFNFIFIKVETIQASVLEAVRLFKGRHLPDNSDSNQGQYIKKLKRYSTHSTITSDRKLIGITNFSNA